MRFAPLSVELIRARPALVFWLVVLARAALWLALPLALYANAPGDLAKTIAIGRDYALAPASGPPLAFWLADIAFRAAGDHLFGLYLLSQICLVITFWALFQLGRDMLGAPQSVLAVLLTMTITAFASDQLVFGPDVLAQPLWSLVLLYAWRIIGRGHRRSWIGLGAASGLLLMTSAAAPLLLGLLLLFMLATDAGRRALASSDSVFALLLIAVLVFPYVLALPQAAVDLSAPFAALSEPATFLTSWMRLTAAALLALLGLAIVALANGRWPRDDDAPLIARPQVPSIATPFVLTFAIAPLPIMAAVSALTGHAALFGGEGPALLMSGLAVMLLAGEALRLRRHSRVRALWLAAMVAPAIFVLGLSLLQPWMFGEEVQTQLPAKDIARFFGETFQRRTGQPLRVLAGDHALVLAVGTAARGRPLLLLGGEPGGGPDLTQRLSELGGIVLWRASDTSGAPPAPIAARFPNLTPEVPATFSRLVQGRQPLLRIGWALVRPAAP